jgi:hypothetical protein
MQHYKVTVVVKKFNHELPKKPYQIASELYTSRHPKPQTKPKIAYLNLL